MDKFPWIFRNSIEVLAKPFAEMETHGFGHEQLAEIGNDFDSALIWARGHGGREVLLDEIVERLEKIDELFNGMDKQHGMACWEFGATRKFKEWTEIQQIAREICERVEF